MKLVWPVFLGLFRSLYLVYSVWCWLFPAVLLGLLYALITGWGEQSAAVQQWAMAGIGVYALLALYAVGYVYQQRVASDPNPWQSGFMAWFGTLKLFRNAGGAAAVKLHWPSAYLVENPRGYRISGTDLRSILKSLQAGDILLRGYEGYVDGEFIRRSSKTSRSGFQPGWFTHAAFYAGELSEQDRSQVPTALQHDPGYFETGAQMVIHAMAKGVHTEDILTFLRCDYLAILRIKPTLSATLTHADIVRAARISALEKIGEEYDFDCSDTQKFDRFSCAELLYYCLRSVHDALGLKPLPHAFYPLAPRFGQLHMLERITITPDDFYELTRQGQLQCVWEDSFSQRVHQSARPPL